ncbi:hypothetical protein ASPWEDRAFT_294655 [Aspergillus wentii DTO 134E9]|uniref:Major facilitator superfamily (MFS) profile domain-containing protein n=1 Tax=Aspergillus wentii DTO 134E9 TaxID=1073089 RepID=A0A1L9R439_ASPWE|nr:uncharacterized protein ASPWEDRAFT_294655 [Aspergillus wentii DTO 134E9]OJJ29685.1 hypothetical protein ASPWEDRAFT_294655 [Aspergillus wentii DTO 134E9]
MDTKTAKDNKDSEAVAHHAETVPALGEIEPYGPPGLRGLTSNPFISLCAACATLGGLSFGYDQGVISVTLVMDQFLNRFPEVSPDASGAGFYKGLMTAMLELGALIGAINQGWVADWISRRYSILVAGTIFTIGAILQTAAVDYAMLTVARLIGGVGIGMMSMVAPVYISEISPPECRGTLLVMEEFSIVLGIVIAFWTTFGTRYIAGEWAWRLPFLLQMVPSTILMIGVFMLPFLDIQAEVRFHKATNMQRHPHLQGGSMKETFLLEMASWADCFKKGCWKRTHIGIVLSFFQQFIGINALIYYSPTLFETMGLDYEMQLVMSGVVNVAQLVGVTTSVWTMDSLGRRALLLAGALVMGVSHMIIAVLVGLFSHDWPSFRAEGWASVALLLVYMVAFGASWGPVAWALPSEIFPSSLRAKGVALSTCSIWLNNFIIGLITPPLVQNTGYGAYTFFAVFCILSFVWVFFFVPETKGRTLENMDEVFKDNSSSEDKGLRYAIEVDLIRERQQSI